MADTKTPATPAGTPMGGMTLAQLKELMEKLTSMQEMAQQIAQMQQDPNMRGAASMIAPMLKATMQVGSAQLTKELMGNLIGTNNMKMFEDAINHGNGGMGTTLKQTSAKGQPYTGTSVDPVATALLWASQQAAVNQQMARMAPYLQTKYGGMGTINPPLHGIGGNAPSSISPGGAGATGNIFNPNFTGFSPAVAAMPAYQQQAILDTLSPHADAPDAAAKKAVQQYQSGTFKDPFSSNSIGNYKSESER